MKKNRRHLSGNESEVSVRLVVSVNVSGSCVSVYILSCCIEHVPSCVFAQENIGETSV